MNPTELRAGLACALASASDVVVVYTDIANIPLWAGSREKTLDVHARAILDACGDRTVLFPTFNYDWCNGGRYNPTTDVAQTGVLNEHVRKHHTLFRTLTPVFNFAVARLTDSRWHAAAPPRLSMDPFGASSVLRWLIGVDATVLAYGAPLRACSALHVAERSWNVPYRYAKTFPGYIEGYGPFTLMYHVQPQCEPPIEYDWPKVEGMLDPLFGAWNIGGATIRTGRAHAIHKRLMRAVERDTHAFLKEPPMELYERYGKPLRRRNVEAAA